MEGRVFAWLVQADAIIVCSIEGARREEATVRVGGYEVRKGSSIGGWLRMRGVSVVLFDGCTRRESDRQDQRRDENPWSGQGSSMHGMPLEIGRLALRCGRMVIPNREIMFAACPQQGWAQSLPARFPRKSAAGRAQWVARGRAEVYQLNSWANLFRSWCWSVARRILVADPTGGRDGLQEDPASIQRHVKV
nr:hypothetical protein CFP56_12280 [Quercus suber]